SGFFLLEVFTRGGLLVSRSDVQASPVSLVPGSNRIGVEVAELPLLDGVYEVNLGVVDRPGGSVLAWREQAATLQVSYDGRASGVIELTPAIRQ
ncbi:MAG: hypothetical protein ACYC5Z_09345, partial [Acidimicrobiales bacterium]